MSNYSKIFSDAKVKIPNKSAFDMSHITQGTIKTGTLTPALCEPLLPGDKFSLGALAEINFAPFATQPYGKIDFCMEAFFVPYRILWGGWQNFITMPENNPFGSPVVRPTNIPTIQLHKLSSSITYPDDVQVGTLCDYLGVNGGFAGDQSSDIKFNILPFLAYHKIYDDWYRNPNIQKPLFVRLAQTGSNPLQSSPWFSATYNISGTQDSPGVHTVFPYNFGDGSTILELHQRNWGKDYFTTSQLYPQASGDVNGSTIDIDGATEISISAIRQANVLQKWIERNNIAGVRYSDQLRATYGVTPSDAVLDRPIFLGCTRTPVYTKGVKITAGNDSSTNNPYSGQAGATAGSALGVSSSSLCDEFTATEHGFVMVIVSVVPHAQYAKGCRRYLKESVVGDIPNPLLQGLGEQPVYTYELYSGLFAEDTIFGYQPQYAHYKYHNDEVHGELQDEASLASFAIQRSFDEDVALDSEFLKIKTDALDQVTAVNSNVSNYIAWYNIGFEFKKISTLSEYVIPTLGELPNTHTETVPFRGTQL